MIILDVYVPAVDKTYNFSLNEDVDIGTIVAEITEMIEQREKMKYAGNIADLNLFSSKSENALPKKNSLSDCYITSGSRLILI